ncbi:helix-turn-helix domain-containing protein [Nakamurella lactea]|uniref:helix-turn-helix domain-containing protein n=1 Tax=Nakamurella lactea TaxID=459515 RepID=UPI0003FB57C3|nr:helix-turn-helix domain-containing protein [Nakamurella lactea]
MCPAAQPDPEYGDGLTFAGRPVEPTSPAGRVRRRATDAERKALASVVRLRILRLCLYEPLTNKQIAERLDRNPASVLHHVRTLVSQGFLAAEQTRPGPRGSREVPYRATGKSWNLDTGPELGGNTMLRTFFDEVAEVPAERVEISRLGLQLSPERLDELRSRLNQVLREYAALPHDPDGQRISMFLAFHPEPR